MDRTDTEVAYGQLRMLHDELERVVQEKSGNLADPRVLAVSQEMDRIIVMLQRTQLKIRVAT